LSGKPGNVREFDGQGRSAANHQGIVREFHIVWRVVTLKKIAAETYIVIKHLTLL